jgi:hypothetical protein
MTHNQQNILNIKLKSKFLSLSKELFTKYFKNILNTVQHNFLLHKLQYYFKETYFGSNSPLKMSTTYTF